jgi:tRNA threonylcarbamoyl adenosine modification protein YeaZ
VLALALDTSSAACGVALVRLAVDRDPEVLGRSDIEGARRHGEVLAPSLTSVLAGADVRPADLSGLVVGLGPGPFTSLRVGIVTAAAMGQALGIPVHGVCSLDGLVDTRPGRVAAVGDARRREVYWAVYEDGTRLEGPYVGPSQHVVEAGVQRAVGAGAELYLDQLDGVLVEEPRYPDPVRLAAIVAPQLLAEAAPGPLVPMYLRHPDAAIPGPPKQVTA